MPHSSIPTTKVCSKCSEEKPATTEYFSRHKANRDGWQSHCKECQRAYYAANKERVKATSRAWYVANREKRIEQTRAYHEANKERRDEYLREYNAANRQRYTQHMRNWRVNNREYENEQERARYAANRERYVEYKREWAAANPEKVKAYKLRRRARVANAEGIHTAEDIRAQYERQKGLCYYCTAKLNESYHMDHIVPLSRGGSNWPDNLVCTCTSCNTSKGDKLPHEWPRGNRLL